MTHYPLFTLSADTDHLHDQSAEVQLPSLLRQRGHLPEPALQAAGRGHRPAEETETG